MSDTVGVNQVPFTVSASLDLGKAAEPWLRECGADVVVRPGDVPESLDNPEAQGVLWQYAPDRVLIKPPAGMRFLVEGGHTIRYATEPGVDDRDVRLFLLGSAWAALVLQRGLLPLHASAVAGGGDVFGFTGLPASGKSTLAAGLSSRGWAFFADDVLVLDPASFASGPRCWGCKDLKLWPDAVAITAAAPGQRVRIADGFDKRYATPPCLSPRVSGRLKDLYVLHRSIGDTPADINGVTGGLLIAELTDAVYRLRYAKAIVGQQQLSQWLLALAGSCRVWRFWRPWTLSQFESSVAHMDGALGA